MDSSGLSFRDWLVSLSTTPARFGHVATLRHGSVSFLLKAERQSIVWTCHILFLHSCIGGHLLSGFLLHSLSYRLQGEASSCAFGVLMGMKGELLGILPCPASHCDHCCSGRSEMSCGCLWVREAGSQGKEPRTVASRGPRAPGLLSG